MARKMHKLPSRWPAIVRFLSRIRTTTYLLYKWAILHLLHSSLMAYTGCPCNRRLTTLNIDASQSIDLRNTVCAPVMTVFKSACPCLSVHTANTRQVLITHGRWCSDIAILVHHFHVRHGSQSVTSPSSSSQTHPSSSSSASNQVYPRSTAPHTSRLNPEARSFHPSSYAVLQHTNERATQYNRSHGHTSLHEFNSHRAPYSGLPPTNGVDYARCHHVPLLQPQPANVPAYSACIDPSALALPTPMQTNIAWSSTPAPAPIVPMYGYVAIDRSYPAARPGIHSAPFVALQAVNTCLPPKPRVPYETRPRTPSRHDMNHIPPCIPTSVEQTWRSPQALQHVSRPSGVLHPHLQSQDKNIWMYPSPEFPLFVPSSGEASADSVDVRDEIITGGERLHSKKYTVQVQNARALAAISYEAPSGSNIAEPSGPIPPRSIMPAIGPRFAAAGTHPSQTQAGLSKFNVRSSRIAVNANLSTDARRDFREWEAERQAIIRRAEDTICELERGQEASETTSFEPVPAESTRDSSAESRRLQYTKRLAPVYSNTRRDEVTPDVATVRTEPDVARIDASTSLLTKAYRPELNALKLHKYSSIKPSPLGPNHRKAGYESVMRRFESVDKARCRQMRPTEAALAMLGEHKAILAVDIDRRKWVLGRCTAAFGTQLLHSHTAHAPIAV